MSLRLRDGLCFCVRSKSTGPIGGLGEAVAFCLAQLSGKRAALLPFSLPEGSTKGVSGDQHYLRLRGGLDPDSIFAAITDAFETNTQT